MAEKSEKTVTVYWKRNTSIENIPRLSAYRKENDIRDFQGVPVKGGQKYSIPNIEENLELIESLGGQWSSKSPSKESEPETPATEEIVVVEEVKKRK